MRILISGASVAGPALAFWLHRFGFQATVVELAPAPRKTGGHAVDLFRPSMHIVGQMGLLDQIKAKATGTERVTLMRKGARPVRTDVVRTLGVRSDDHAEIMRDDLSEILYNATEADVEYLFGDSIGSMDEVGDGVEVTFEKGGPRRFDLVIGADGLHSNVRGLLFGDEEQFTHYLGGYVSVLTVPNSLGLSKEMLLMASPGRLAGLYSPEHLDEARALFIFRTPRRLEYHYRDTERKKHLLREHFEGVGRFVPHVLAELDRTPAFYFDEITQLRLDTWSRGRVALVGDAAYCPGPAVGGSTSMAIVGAYVLAGVLAAAHGDHQVAFRAYEREMADYVKRARSYAIRMSGQVVPDTRWKIWAGAQAMRLQSVMPAGLARAVTRLAGTGSGVHDGIQVEQFADGSTSTLRSS